MRKSYPITLTKKIGDATFQKEFKLNMREKDLYLYLSQHKGQLCKISDICEALGFTKEYLRVTKNNLSRLTEGWLEIGAVYGKGYFIK